MSEQTIKKVSKLKHRSNRWVVFCKLMYLDEGGRCKEEFLEALFREGQLPCRPRIGQQIVSFGPLSGDTITEMLEDHLTILIFVEDGAPSGDQGDDWGNKMQVVQTLQAYVSRGWTFRDPKIQAIITSQRLRIAQRESLLRQRMGYVLPDISPDGRLQEISAYQGGFSDAVFQHPRLQDYLREFVPSFGFAFGYIGNLNRTVAIDRWLELKFVHMGASPGALADFVSSKRGRWFGDQVSCLRDVLKFASLCEVYAHGAIPPD